VGCYGQMNMGNNEVEKLNIWTQGPSNSTQKYLPKENKNMYVHKVVQECSHQPYP
jgi:hypothetical protein